MLRDLRGLSKDGAEFVAGHLVAAGSLADEEPDLAWLHARAARARGGRIAVVRETVGLVAYRAGEWAEAIGELRAARRMGGGPGHLAVMADSERALGHPERAIELSRSAEADDLDEDAAIELAIVVAGARADLGQIDAALAHLERIGWREEAPNARIAYAYADLLLQAGRRQEALTWFVRAADADTDEETDAGDRLAALSASLDDDGPAAATADKETDTAVSNPQPVAGPAARVEQGPDSGADAGGTEDPGESGTAGPETVAAINAGAGDVVIDTGSTDRGDVETDYPATTSDAGVVRTDNPAAATDDHTDADTGSAPEQSLAGESDGEGLAPAPDASVTDTDTDSKGGVSTATTTDPTPGAGDASPSPEPLFVPPLFSDDPLAGDR